MAEFERKSHAEIQALDPLDFEIGQGLKVRDLTTPDECAAAAIRLENEVGKIMSQIARAESDPSTVRPGWRTSAQGAIRWKNRAISAAKERGAVLTRAANAGKSQKGKAILKVIREDIGEEAFEEYVDAARRRYPEAWEPVDSGEN